MYSVIWIINILSAIGVIGLVLIQHGKGADVGAAFGSGSAGSLFGASGAANFLSRTTAALAVVFFVTCLALTYVSSRQERASGVIGAEPVNATPATPATPSGSAAPPATPSGNAAPAAPSAAPAASGSSSQGGDNKEIPK